MVNHLAFILFIRVIQEGFTNVLSWEAFESMYHSAVGRGSRVSCLVCITRYVVVAQAQVNEGVGSAGRVDVALGHVINEDKAAGPVQLHRLLVVHGHEQIYILLTQPIRIVQLCPVFFLVALSTGVGNATTLEALRALKGRCTSDWN
jgi:hypothetical protein